MTLEAQSINFNSSGHLIVVVKLVKNFLEERKKS